MAQYKRMPPELEEEYKRMYPQHLEEEKDDGPIRMVRLSDAERNIDGFRLGPFMLIVEKDYWDELHSPPIPATGQDSAMEIALDS